MCNGNDFYKPVKTKLPTISTDLSVEKLERVENNNKNIVQKNDILSEMTQQTKLLLKQFSAICNVVQSWRYYRMFRGKTQPAHFLTIISVLLIGRVLQSDIDNERKYLSTESTLMKLVYLGSFAAHFGSQIWMTFVSGLSLYFALPRHTFGSVQRVLFPKYFSVNSILSFATVCSFVKCHTTSDHYFQILILVSCFLIELVIRLYLTPSLVKLMTEKTRIEKAAGIGLEVGEYKPGSLTKCPHYLMVHTSFRKVHMIIAIGNMMCMACTFAHLFYLSQRICI